MGKEKSDTSWRSILEPIIAKFNAAWLSNGNAIWNGEGAKAMAALLTEMGGHLDNGDGYFIPRHQLATLEPQIREAFEAGYKAAMPHESPEQQDQLEEAWTRFIGRLKRPNSGRKTAS